jgi:hypothetical protein
MKTPQTAVAIRTPLADMEFGNELEANEAYEGHLVEISNQVPVAVQKSNAIISNEEKKKFLMKAGLIGGSALVVGYVVLEILGILLAAGAATIVFGGIYWWWKFKLPGQIARAQAARELEIQRAHSKYVEAAQAERISHLEKLKRQAEANPIETLELDLEKMYAERTALRAANTAFRTQERSLTEDLQHSRRDNPEVDYSEQEVQLKEFTTICDADDAELSDFIVAINQTEAVLKEARSKWNFAVKLDAALAQRDAARGNEVQRKILKDTALDSIRERHAKLFARMHTRAVELSAAKTIKVGGVNVDVSNIKLINKEQ